MLNIQLIESLKSQDFSSLTKEERKQVQLYNRTKQTAELLDNRINEHGSQQYTISLFENLKQFINLDKYSITFDGTFYTLTK